MMMHRKDGIRSIVHIRSYTGRRGREALFPGRGRDTDSMSIIDCYEIWRETVIGFETKQHLCERICWV